MVFRNNGFRAGIAAFAAVFALALAACGGDDPPAEEITFEVPRISMLTDSGVRITWDTNVPTEGEIRYGISGADLSATLDVPSMSRAHSVSVAGLEPETAYAYQIVAVDDAGNTATSDVYTFTTRAYGEDMVEDTEGYEVAIIETKFGNIVIRFLEDVAPKHTANFKELVEKGFYNGITFHRVIPGFIIQAGDPLSRDQSQRGRHGTGGPGYTIPAEINAKHILGAVAAARTGDQVNPQRRSSGSQFYITLAPTPMLDNQYTVFGQVIEGMDVAQQIAEVQRDARDNPTDPIAMERVWLETRTDLP